LADYKEKESVIHKRTDAGKDKNQRKLHAIYVYIFNIDILLQNKTIL